MKKLFSACFFFLIISQIHAATKVGKFGLYIKNLYLDEAKCVFHADLYWWLKFDHNGDTSDIGDLCKLEFVNSERFENTIYEKNVDDKQVYLNGYYSGDFRYYPSYKFYPFDKQTLKFQVENITLNTDSLLLVPDIKAFDLHGNKNLSIDPNIILPGYTLLQPGYHTSKKIYNTNFGDENYGTNLAYSRLEYWIQIKRHSKGFIVKILIPNILILIMAYLVFFVPAKELEVAVGLTVTSLLASIALQLSISNGLPNVGYLITSDKIFYLFYLLITAAMVQTVWSNNLQKNNNIALAARLDTIGRFLYPVVFLAGILLICFEYKFYE